MRPQYKNPEHQHFNDKLPLVYGSNTDSSLNGLNDLNDVYDLNNENKRKKFISKVYFILWIQLIFTSLFIGICNQVKEVSYFMLSYIGVQLSALCMIILFISSICLFCCNEKIRKKPYNWIYVILFTICMTYLIGFVGLSMNTQSLLLGGLITSFIFISLTIYAWQTKIDYTIYGNIILILLFGLILFGIIISFFDVTILNTIYAVCGSILFSFYIVYDTQLIVGGKHRSIQFRTNDFAIASISLYLDIINLFLFIMDILNGGSSSR